MNDGGRLLRVNQRAVRTVADAIVGVATALAQDPGRAPDRLVGDDDWSVGPASRALTVAVDAHLRALAGEVTQSASDLRLITDWYAGADLRAAGRFRSLL